MGERYDYDGITVFTIRRQDDNMYRVHDGEEEVGRYDGVYIDDCRLSSDKGCSVDLQARSAVEADGVITFFTR